MGTDFPLVPTLSCSKTRSYVRYATFGSAMFQGGICKGTQVCRQAATAHDVPFDRKNTCQKRRYKSRLTRSLLSSQCLLWTNQAVCFIFLTLLFTIANLPQRQYFSASVQKLCVLPVAVLGSTQRGAGGIVRGHPCFFLGLEFRKVSHFRKKMPWSPLWCFSTWSKIGHYYLKQLAAFSVKAIVRPLRQNALETRPN